jgi:hypothetical protein
LNEAASDILFGVLIALLVVVSVGFVATAGPYNDIDCDPEGGIGVTQDASHPPIAVHEVCNDRQAALHPLVFDLQVKAQYLLGMDPYTITQEELTDE